MYLINKENDVLIIINDKKCINVFPIAGDTSGFKIFFL